jgi:hypothetical protein
MMNQNETRPASASTRGLAQVALLALSCTALAFGQAPVDVKNGIKDPLPVKDLSAHNAVVISALAPVDGGWSPAAYTVPARKRLVIEYIAYEIETLATSAVVRLRARFNGATHIGTYGHTSVLTQRVLGSHAVKVYVDAGQVVTVSAETAQTGFGAARITLAGYLVDMPLVFTTVP